jgi:hypothetical protein
MKVPACGGLDLVPETVPLLSGLFHRAHGAGRGVKAPNAEAWDEALHLLIGSPTLTPRPPPAGIYG